MVPLQSRRVAAENNPVGVGRVPSRFAAICVDPVLAPAAVDERLDLVDIRISSGHGARPPRALVGRVDAELAAVALERRRVIELVERALGEHDVALRVDVRADAEEHLVVVVHVHVLVDDDDRLRQAEQARAPRPHA
jgi:hypothetical protein